MRMVSSCLAVAALLSLSSVNYADVTQTVTGRILSLRVEGTVAFVGLSSSLASEGCGGRLWVDLNSEVGRVIYSTAMMAFAAGKETLIRADNGVARVFGECRLYDIYVR